MKIRSQRGSILIAVLALVFFMSLAMMTILKEAEDVMVKDGQPFRQPALRLEAYQALEVALGVLGEFLMTDGGLYHPSQGWGDLTDKMDWEIREGIQIWVTVTDLSSRFPLAQLMEDESWWEPFLQEWDIPIGDRPGLRDSILDWMTEGGQGGRPSGGDANFYRLRNPPYQPPGRLIRDWEELRLIRVAEDLFFDETGDANDYFRRFTGDVSLRNQGAVNVNTASDTTLLAMMRRANADGPALIRQLAGFDGERGTDEDLLVTDINQLNIPSGLQSFLRANTEQIRIQVEARRGEATFVLFGEFSVGSPSGTNYPFELITIRENQSF